MKESESVHREAGNPHGDEKLFWWVKAHWMILFLLLPLFLFLVAGGIPLPDLVQDNCNKSYQTYGMTYLMLLGTFALIGYQTSVPIKGPRNQLSIPPALLDVTAAFTIAAYVIWLGPILLNFDAITQAMARSFIGLRQQGRTIPGVTTFSQLGVMYLLMYTVSLFTLKQSLNSRHHVFLGVIIVCIILRVVLWSERMGLIEAVVPVGIVIACHSALIRKRRALSGAMMMAPIFGLILLLAVFGVFEYGRSWYFYQDQYESYPLFVIERVSFYYTTSIQNGCMLLEHGQWPNQNYQYMFDFLHNFPVIGTMFSDLLNTESSFSEILLSYGADEFNNPSGIFTIIHDLGLLGAAIFAIALGYIIGWMNGQFFNRTALGLMVYPVLFVGVLEVFRIPYFTLGRFFPIIVWACLSAYIIQKHSLSDHQ